MIGIFLASLNGSIRCKVWKQENLPSIMIEMLYVMIRLWDDIEVGRSDIPSGKRPSDNPLEVARINFVTGNTKWVRNSKGGQVANQLPPKVKSSDHSESIRSTRLRNKYVLNVANQIIGRINVVKIQTNAERWNFFLPKYCHLKNNLKISRDLSQKDSFDFSTRTLGARELKSEYASYRGWLQGETLFN